MERGEVWVCESSIGKDPIIVLVQHWADLNSRIFFSTRFQFKISLKTFLEELSGVKFQRKGIRESLQLWAN